MGFSLLDSGRGILGRHFLRSVHVSVARECKPLLSATRMEDNMKHANTAVSYMASHHLYIERVYPTYHCTTELSKNIPFCYQGYMAAY